METLTLPQPLLEKVVSNEKLLQQHFSQSDGKVCLCSVWTDIIDIQNDWLPPTNVSLKDVGGIGEALLHDLMEYIAYPLLRPDVYIKTGIRPPR